MAHRGVLYRQPKWKLISFFQPSNASATSFFTPHLDKDFVSLWEFWKWCVCVQLMAKGEKGEKKEQVLSFLYLDPH